MGTENWRVWVGITYWQYLSGSLLIRIGKIINRLKISEFCRRIEDNPIYKDGTVIWLEAQIGEENLLRTDFIIPFHQLIGLQDSDMDYIRGELLVKLSDFIRDKLAEKLSW
jgi:hypothetical protein